MNYVTVSIISHGQGLLVKNLLGQLLQFPEHIARVVVTYNVPEEEYLRLQEYSFDLIIIHNKCSLGFGANHNQAFKHCRTKYFCVMNPDIQLTEDPFGLLLSCDVNPATAVIGPMIVNPVGLLEDSARYFPTPWDLFKKAFGHYDGIYQTREDRTVEYPDWLAGMFLLIKSDKYSELSGFDESFFLYYEDVDFCARVWRKGYMVALCKEATVIHDARRSSRSEFKFFKWHIASALRFFLKYWGRLPKKSLKR